MKEHISPNAVKEAFEYFDLHCTELEETESDKKLYQPIDTSIYGKPVGTRLVSNRSIMIDAVFNGIGNYTAWVLTGILSLSCKAVVVLCRVALQVLVGIVSSLFTSIGRGLDSGFVDYDWSTPKGQDDCNSEFKHTTTYQDVTITVTKGE